MDKQYTSSRKWKGIAVGAIAGFALAALFYRLNGGAGHGCDVLSETAWFILKILHPVMVAGGQSVEAYLAENTRCLRHLLQIVASVGPVLCCVAG
jgi:hypothetical protein